MVCAGDGGWGSVGWGEMLHHLDNFTLLTSAVIHTPTLLPQISPPTPPPPPLFPFTTARLPDFLKVQKPPWPAAVGRIRPGA